MADSTDLLHISDTLDEINGESIDDTPDYGMNYTYLYIGMSGQRMVDKMNENWHATDSEFLAIATALGLRIISPDIKEIKVENNVVYYTTDGETWKSLQASWGNIAGNLGNQTDLVEALADKVSSETFNALVGRVDTNAINIALLNDDLTQTNTTLTGVYNQINAVNGILSRLTAAESSLETKISSPSVVAIRTVNGTSLEFTTDGENWYPVSSAGIVLWGQIEGNINEQPDLRREFENINGDISDVSTALTTHTNNTNNPHQVTASQLGLGNVNNTSDLDKPVSTAQSNAIATAKSEAISQATSTAASSAKFQSLTQTEYEALQTKDSNTIYFINNL